MRIRSKPVHWDRVRTESRFARTTLLYSVLASDRPRLYVFFIFVFLVVKYCQLPNVRRACSSIRTRNAGIAQRLLITISRVVRIFLHARLITGHKKLLRVALNKKKKKSPFEKFTKKKENDNLRITKNSFAWTGGRNGN